MLRPLKRKCFALLRRNILSKKVRDLHNYLNNIEIKNATRELDGKTVLVVAPHPDDEVLGCGSTVRQVVNSGGKVDVVFLTKGELGTDPTNPLSTQELTDLRQSEAERAAKILGIRKLIFLNGPDGALHTADSLYLKLREVLVKQTYDLVLSTAPTDAHSDHLAAAKILSSALEEGSKISIWLYEVWNPVIANRIVEIDDTIDTKMQALSCYESQTRQIDYAGAIRGLAKYRSLLLRTSQYAEAFLSIDAATLRSICGLKRTE